MKAKEDAPNIDHQKIFKIRKRHETRLHVHSPAGTRHHHSLILVSQHVNDHPINMGHMSLKKSKS